VRFGEYHDPLTAPALTLAANAWFRRVLHQYDRKAYDDIFGFASIQRAEKHSPIVLELGIVVAASVLVAPMLAYCLLRAVHRHRENEVKQEIWEAQRDAYREFARQQRAKAIILEELAAEPIRDAHGLRLGDSVLEALANVAAPSVADLSGSPIIEKVTFGVNVDTK
jgi:hypothetical protein